MFSIRIKPNMMSFLSHLVQAAIHIKKAKMLPWVAKITEQVSQNIPFQKIFCNIKIRIFLMTFLARSSSTVHSASRNCCRQDSLTPCHLEKLLLIERRYQPKERD